MEEKPPVCRECFQELTGHPSTDDGFCSDFCMHKFDAELNEEEEDIAG